MTLTEKLSAIQRRLKAPKNLVNKFGGYNYRNLEGICEAVKPYLDEYKVALTISDEIAVYGDRVYVRAVVTLHDCESNAKIDNTALAREAESKKGMDDSQITGTASSYARKYAMNGLFLLDDTKDADTDEHRVETTERDKKARVDEKKAQNDVVKALQDCGIDLKFCLSLYKVNEVYDLSDKQCDNIMKHLEDIKAKQEAKK